jgi:hypothetical protein
VREWCRSDVRKERSRGPVGGLDFIVGSVKGAAGKVKVRDWHFTGTEHNAKMAQDGEP